MKLYRVMAVATRYYLPFFRDKARLLDSFYWALLDFVVWGFVGVWVQGQQAQSSQLMFTMLTILVFWQVVVRTSLEYSRGMLDELQAQNLANFFATPLTLTEWAVGAGIASSINMFTVLLFCAFLVWLFYGVVIFSLGFLLLPLFLSLLISGWAIGLLGAALVVRWGLRIQSIIWALAWGTAPFCAVYYPLEVLPLPMQKIAAAFPMTYIFEGIRKVVLTGSMPMHDILHSFALNGVYLFVMAFVLKYLFVQSRQRGLARL